MSETVYLKTEPGRHAFKDRVAGITLRQRSAFILFDGTRTVAQVLAATVGLGVQQDDIRTLVLQGYLEVMPTLEAVLLASSGSVKNSAIAMNSVTNTTVGLQTHPSSSQPQPIASLPAGLVPPSTFSASQQRYQRAYPIAAQLTAGLGFRGFRLHMAVEAAGGYEQLLVLAPKIREALGVEKCRLLDAALTE